MSITELHDEPEFLSAVLDDRVLDTLAPAIPAADVEELRGRVHGPVYVAGDDGLAAEVAAWNVAFSHTPAMAVGATCAEDVAAAVAFAATHDLQVTVHATGHAPVRNAAGALMITTRRMQGLHVAPLRRTASVEAGVKWHRVLEAAAPYGLAGLCGSSSDRGALASPPPGRRGSPR